MGKKEDFLLSVLEYNLEWIRKDLYINIHLEDDEENMEIRITSLKTVLYSITYDNKEKAIRQMSKNLLLYSLRHLSKQKPIGIKDEEVQGNSVRL